MLPTPTGVAGPTRGETHKVSLPMTTPGPGTSPAWQPHSKRLSGCRATKQLRYPNSWGSISTSPTRIGGEQGKPSTWEAHLTVHPSENAQPGKERQPMWSQPVHDPHKNTRVPAPPKGTQGLGHYFVLDHSLIAKMVEQAKVQYLGCRDTTASRRTAYPEKKEHPCGHPRITIPGILNHKRKPQVRRVFRPQSGPHK